MAHDPGGTAAASHQSDILAAVLDVARRVVQADGFAIWRLDRGHWDICAFAGVSAAFANNALARARTAPVAPLQSPEPLVFEDVRAAPMLDDWRRALDKEGIRSMAAVPLVIAGQYTAS